MREKREERRENRVRKIEVEGTKRKLKEKKIHQNEQTNK
jgi:hypothetical protein